MFEAEIQWRIGIASDEFRKLSKVLMDRKKIDRV